MMETETSSNTSPIMDSVMIESQSLLPEQEHIQNGENRTEDLQNSDSQSQLPLFKISIDNVSQKVDGLTPYTTYRVVTETSHKNFKNSSNIVWRRYSDFLWIYSKLKSAHKICLVPTLPEKDFLGKNDTQVTEYRRRELQRFLTRVVNHEILREDLSLRDFLEANEREMVLLRNQTIEGANDNIESSNPNSAPSFSFFGLWKSAPQTHVYNEKDAWFARFDQYLLRLDNQMNITKRTVHSFALKTKEISMCHSDICVQFGELKDTESKESEELSLSLARYADASKSLCLCYEDLSNIYKQELEDSLSDHHRMIRAIRELLKYRTQLLTDYESSNALLLTKRSRGEDVLQLKEEVIKKEENARKASENIQKEIENFQKMKAVELKTAICNIISSNKKQFENIYREWQSVHQELTRDVEEAS